MRFPFLFVEGEPPNPMSPAMKRDVVIQNILYGILLSAFLILYFILSINSRLSADDFFFLNNLDAHGWWQSMLLSWHSWVTRWTSILWLNSIFSFYNLSGNFLFFHIVTLLMLVFALYRFSVFSMDFIIRNSAYKSPGLTALADLPRHSRFAVSFLISFFILTTGVGETFFWITSSAMYLWSFIAVCFLLAEVLRGEKSVSTLVVCVLTAAYIGGAAEAIAIPCFILLLLILAFQLRKKMLKPATAISIAVLFVSILISYSGEGRVLRQSALPDISLLQSVTLNFRSFAQIELYFLSEKFLFIILFFIAWMGFGAKLPFALNVNFKLFAWVLGSYALLSFIFIFPSSYLLGEIPPLRARIFVGFLNCCLLAFAGVVTGAYFHRPLITSIISSVAVIVLVVMVGKIAIEQKKITTNYAVAVDKRMLFLKSFVYLGDNAPITLDPLPDSGMLLSSEISSNPTDFRNQHLKKYFGITNDIILKE